MRLPIPLTLALVVGLAACSRPADRTTRGTVYRALRVVLVYPKSVMVSPSRCAASSTTPRAWPSTSVVRTFL